MGKIGKLKVKLDKPYYIAGEVCSGVVYMKNKAPVELDKVSVKIKGKEKVVWEEHWDTPIYQGEGEERRKVGDEHHVAEYDEKESFFKKKVKITGQDTFLPPGKWAFPFSFQIPMTGKKGSKLTGSFKVKEGRSFGWSGTRGDVRNLKAKIEYSLKAKVDLEDCKDLEKKVDFTVYEQLPSAIALPSDFKSQDVMFLCCINKGNLSIKATLDKNFYCPGEMATAIAEISNKSTMDIVAKVELNRIMRLKADGHTIYDKDMQNLGRFDTVRAGEDKTVRMQFQIPNTLPSTDGHYLDCKYIMDVLAEIDWAPDIECHFPVNIFMPQMPPAAYLGDFDDDIGEYQVLAPCVVVDWALKPGYY